MDIHDLSSLGKVTRESVIAVLEERYDGGKFFTLAASALLHITSPNETQINQELQDFRSGKGCSAIVETAHLFSFISRISRQLNNEKVSHTIYISGEAGARKTTTANNAILFLTRKQPKMAFLWECAHTLLKGISQTPGTLDDGSSTRSLLVKSVYFAENGVASGGGLELPRIFNQDSFNFNIFYYITAGLTDEQRKTYHIPINTRHRFKYVKTIEDEAVEICADHFTMFTNAFTCIVKAPELLESFLRTLGAILHLGELRLACTPATSSISFENPEALKICAELLCLKNSVLEELFLSPGVIEDGYNIIQDFGMNLYSSLSLWLVDSINRVLKNSSSTTFDPAHPSVTIIDQYGYSTKTHQTPSDFFVNMANERQMQQFCRAMRKDYKTNLNYSDSCAEFFEKMNELLLSPFNAPMEESTFRTEVKKICTSSIFAAVSGDDNVLECKHFFQNTSYDITQLYHYAKRSSPKQVEQVGKVKDQALSLWMEKDFISSISPCRPGNLFTKHSVLPEGENTESHFVFCLRPSPLNDCSFDPNYILTQMKAHGIIKLVAKNHVHARLCVNSMSSANYYDYLSPEFPRKQANRARYKIKTGTGGIPQSVSSDQLAERPSVKKSLSYNAGKPKFPKRPISLRLRDSTFDCKTSKSYACLPTVGKTKLLLKSQDELLIDDELSYSLSADDLTDISELSEESEEGEENNGPWQSTRAFGTMKHFPVKALSSAVLLATRDANGNLIVNGKDSISLLASGISASKIKEHRNQFLIMYACGSLLRSYAVVMEDKNIASIISPHRLPEPALGTSSMRSLLETRRNSATELPIIPDAVKKSEPAIPHAKSQQDGLRRISPRLKIKAGWQQTASEVNMREMKEWERKSIRMRKHSILPLLNLESGDEVINQVNYNNTIRTTPRISKPSISMIQGATFQAYAETRFILDKKCKVGSSKHRAKLKKLICATKSPLKRPLHPLRPPFDKLAVDNFRHILLYASSKPGGGNRSTEAFVHVRGIVELGLERAKLRDEIYCQIIKQTQNIKGKCEILMWELLAICCGCFAPCDFYRCLVNFLDQTCMDPGEFGSWAAYCKERLLKISAQGKRLFVPINREIISIQDRKPLFETFFFMDGKQKQIPIYSTTNAMEALEFLLQMIGQ